MHDKYPQSHAKRVIEDTKHGWDTLTNKILYTLKNAIFLLLLIRRLIITDMSWIGLYTTIVTQTDRVILSPLWNFKKIIYGLLENFEFKDFSALYSVYITELV
jgi:hypothetical protein